MPLQYWKDKSGHLEKIFRKVKKEFPRLKPAKILYTFRSEPKYDEEGKPVAGEARRLPNRERDLYGYDLEVCVHEDTWQSYGKKYRKQLAWHELRHCQVDYEENEDGTETTTPKKDAAGRISVWLDDHDINIKSFMDEIERFDPWPQDANTIWTLYKYCKKNMKKVKRARKKYLNSLDDKD